MKKIYLLFLAASIGYTSYGQRAAQNTIPFKTSFGGESTKQITQNPNEKGAVLWSDDFSTPANWVMTNSSVPATDWVITTNVNAGPVSTLNPAGMTTAANGYAIIDSDVMGNSATQDASITLVTPIDLSGEPNVSIVFQQVTRRYAETTTLRVSGDNGGSWTDFEINAGMPANSNSPNPETISVNISAVAGDSSQVLIQFHYLAAWDWFWAIDDIEIQVTDDNDLVGSDGYYGTAAFPYTRIPVDQIQPIDFSMEARNNGAVDQTNCILTTDINSGTFTLTSATPSTIVVGASDSLFTPSWTPATTVGTPYDVTLTISSDSTEASPINNTVSFPPFEVSNYIYAYDDYGTPGAGGGEDGNAPGSYEFEAGNYYDIWATDDLYAIELVVGSGTPAGTNIEGVLYEIDANGDFVSLATTPFYATTSGDINNVVNLIFPTPQTLNPNTTYFIAVHTFTEFYYGISGSSPDGQGTAAQTSLIFYPDMVNPVGSYYTSQTPMIRMNFDPNIVGVNEVVNNASFNVFPNPSAGEFNINLSSIEANNVELTIKNVLGKTIVNKTVAVSGNTVETISLSDYSKGVYFLTIDNNTVKLIVE